MKIIYTGKPAEFLPKERTKLEGKLAKAVKLIERKGEKDVHVFLSHERHLHNVEVTLNAFDHTLVGKGSDGDFVTAMHEAIEKLEKQVQKMRTRWRATHRGSAVKEPEVAAPVVKKTSAKSVKAAPPVKAAKKPKVFRVNHNDGRKPMTLEEAILEIDDAEYLVYRDAKTDRVATLVRRADGHLDLIES